MHFDFFKYYFVTINTRQINNIWADEIFLFIWILLILCKQERSYIKLTIICHFINRHPQLTVSPLPYLLFKSEMNNENTNELELEKNAYLISVNSS